MREADDTAHRRARLFVDSREAALDHIGELRDPIARGVIAAAAVVADFSDLGKFRRGPQASSISHFNNVGGAYPDLMTARYILSVAQT